MTSPSEPRTPSLYHAGAAPAVPPLVATGVMLGGVATMVVVGIASQAVGLAVLPALVLGELFLLAIPLATIRTLDLRRSALGLRWPRPSLLVAAALIGATTWYLNVRLVDLMFRETTAPSLEHLVDQPPLIVALLAIALIPAICEEVMFRGCVQRALATRLYPAAAIGLTSLLFAGYHMSLIQLVPTFTLALLLGTLARRGDSVVPAMLAHFLNNTLAILVTRRQPAGLAGWLDSHPNAALAGCAIGTLAGIAVIAKAPA